MNEKQLYLKQHIKDQGYDVEEFTEHMASLKEDGELIDNWTIDEIKNIVQKYIGTHDIKTAEKLTKSLIPTTDCKLLYSDELQSVKQYPQTPLHGKNIKVKVSNIARKKEGFLKLNKTTFEITTTILNWKVHRQYKQISWLREKLQLHYPFIIMPPLMSKTINLKEVAPEKKELYLNYFFEFLLQIPEICASTLLIKFLSENTIDEKSIGLQESKIIETMDGKANCNILAGNIAFLNNLMPNLNIYKDCYQRIASLMHHLAEKYSDISSINKDITAQFNIIAEKSKKMQFTKHSELISKIGDNFNSIGKQFQKLGSLFENDWVNIMQMLDKGVDSVQDVAKKCLENHSNFLKTKQSLLAKKEKLFLVKNISAWELPESKSNLLNNKIEALKEMLPKATHELGELQNLAGFGFNMFRKESENYFNTIQNQISYITTDGLTQSILGYNDISKQFQAIIIHVNSKL